MRTSPVVSWMITVATYPTITPRKIEMRPRNPRNSTLKRITATSVMVPGSGCSWKFDHATGRG